MGKPLPWVATAIMMAVAFAGCISAESGPSSEGAPGQPQVSSGPAEFDETTGAIQGIVTDGELVPIPGAQVGILKSDLIPEDIVVLTDENGAFTMSHVPPGDHTLTAQALGYQSTASRVSVQAGAVSNPTVVLEVLPTDEPFHVTVFQKVQLSGVMYKGTPECLYFSGYVPPETPNRNLLKTCGGLQTTFPGSPSCTCQVHTNIDKRFASFDANWTTIVAEMSWKPQTGVSGRGFLFDLNAPNITRSTGGSIDQNDPKTWYKATNKAPIIHRVDKPETLLARKIPEVDWNNYEPTACTAPTPSKTNNPNCGWFFRVFPAYCDLGTCDNLPDYGVMIDGIGEVYFSYFIRETAAPGWTALPDR